MRAKWLSSSAPLALKLREGGFISPRFTAIALSRRILFEGDAAAHRYMRFLERGSSASAMEVLRDAGVDMANPEPVKKTVDLFRSTVEELETLLA